MEISEVQYLQNIREKFRDAILEKFDHKLECIVCSKKEFGMEGLFRELIQSSYPERYKICGENVPTMFLVCTNCGYCMNFAMGSLKLIKYL